MPILVEILEGNRRKLTATFRVPGDGADLDDFSSWDLTDPTTVKLFRKRLRAADATIETFDYALAGVTRESLGVYSKVLDFDTNGTWVLAAQGTGACRAYDEVAIVIKNAEGRP